VRFEHPQLSPKTHQTRIRSQFQGLRGPCYQASCHPQKTQPSLKIYSHTSQFLQQAQIKPIIFERVTENMRTVLPSLGLLRLHPSPQDIKVQHHCATITLSSKSSKPTRTGDRITALTCLYARWYLPLHNQPACTAIYNLAGIIFSISTPRISENSEFREF
jgi:hypothetical protein